MLLAALDRDDEVASQASRGSRRSRGTASSRRGGSQRGGSQWGRGGGQWGGSQRGDDVRRVRIREDASVEPSVDSFNSSSRKQHTMRDKKMMLELLMAERAEEYVPTPFQRPNAATRRNTRRSTRHNAPPPPPPPQFTTHHHHHKLPQARLAAGDAAA